MLPGVQRVWGNEPSHSQVNSHVGSWSPERTPESSELDCRGQNSLPRGVIYVIEKLLKCRCLKWARIAHLNICNTSYGQMNGRESNWQFSSRPLKVGNRPDILGCRRRATYRWKALDEGYNFALNRVTIGGLHKKLCALKVVGFPADAISGLPLGSPGTKNHLDVAPVERRRVNPLRGGRQQPHQSLKKLRKYKGGSRRHEMAASPSPKMRPWSHSVLKASSMLFWLSLVLSWLEDLMAFQVAMPTSVVASQDWSRTLLREYWPSKCLRHLSNQR
jgi:hypothetical protein